MTIQDAAKRSIEATGYIEVLAAAANSDCPRVMRAGERVRCSAQAQLNRLAILEPTRRTPVGFSNERLSREVNELWGLLDRNSANRQPLWKLALELLRAAIPLLALAQ